MSINLRGLRVFIASPGGLSEERRLFREIIQKYNDDEAVFRNIVFLPVRWEEVLGGIARPQHLINADVRTSDYMVILLHDRWGSPPSADPDCEYDSGVAEEYSVAMRCLKDASMPMKDIAIFFKDVPSEKLINPDQQLQKVLDFRKDLLNSQEVLFHQYASPIRFADMLRSFLGKWSREYSVGAEQKAWPVTNIGGSSFSAPSTIQTIEFPGEPEPRASSKLVVEKAAQLHNEGRTEEAKMVYLRSVFSQSDYYLLDQYAKFLFHIGERDSARGIYDEILQDNQQDPGWRARASANLAIIAQAQGDLATAEDFLEASRKYNEQMNHKEGLADSLSKLSEVYRTRGDLKRALAAAEQGRDIYRELGLQEGIADCTVRIGIVQRIYGKLDKAEELYLSAQGLYESLGIRGRYADVLGYLGTIRRVKGRYNDALELYESALKIDIELDRKQEIAEEKGHIGLIKRILGDAESAHITIEESLSECEQITWKEGIAKQNSNLGAVLWMLGDAAQSETRLRISLNRNKELGCKEGIAAVFNNFGSLYLITGDVQEADVYTRQARMLNEEMGNKEGLCENLIQIAKIYQTGLKGSDGLNESLNLAAEATELAQTIGATPLIATAIETIAVTYELIGDGGKALKRYLECLELFRAMGKTKELAKTETAIRNLGDD